jgi:hypothetical protein
MTRDSGDLLRGVLELHGCVPSHYPGLRQRITEVFPQVKTTLQRTHTLDSQLLQFLCHPGTGRFFGSSTVKDDLLVLGEHIGAAGYIIGQNPDGARQRALVGNRIERVAKV